MRTSVREVFAVAAEGYGRDNPLLAVERPQTALLLPILAGQEVLDLGAGHGHYAVMARRLGARMAIAADLTPEMVAGAPPPAVVADAEGLPFPDGAFDVVIAALVLSYVRRVEAALVEVARVLRPGGILVLSDLHPVAGEKGWHRTFAGPSGGQVEARAVPHSAERLTFGMAAAGMAVEVRREPAIGPGLEPHFRRAGRSDFEALRGTPLLLQFRARKGGGR